MHYAKRYAELLLTLPPELRENAIEYRQAGSHKFYSDRPPEFNDHPVKKANQPSS